MGPSCTYVVVVECLPIELSCWQAIESLIERVHWLVFCAGKTRILFDGWRFVQIKCENKLANSNLTMKPMSPVVPTCDSLAETSDGKLCLDQESAKDSKKKSLQEILAEGRTFKEFVPAQNSQISILSDNNLFCDNFSEFEPNSVDISSYSYPEEIFIYDIM